MLLDDLSDFISANQSVVVHKGGLQEVPNTAIALRETGGFPPEYVAGAKAAIVEEPTVQVITRASEYVTAMATCRTVHYILSGARDLTINGVLYHFIRAMQPPFFFMRDDNHRYLCAFNIHVTRRNVL